MSRRMSVVTVALLGLTSAGPFAQQPPPPPASTAFILGRVVDAGTGRPLARATVTIRPTRAPGSPQPPVSSGGAIVGPTRVMTDDEGRFLFHGLPAGAFAIEASKPGYMSGAYGRRTPASPATGPPVPIPVAAGEQKSNITVSLWKYAVIGGRIVDERGDPMIGVQVRVLKRTFVAGRARLSQTGNMPATDDRGIYRMSTLEPGEYVAGVVWTQATMPADVLDSYGAAVTSGDSLGFTRMLSASGGSVLREGVRVGDLLLGQGSSAPGAGPGTRVPAIVPPGSSRLLVYPTVYHPGVATPADASVVAVSAGEERLNVDFQLRPVPSMRVSGTVTGPDGPMAHTRLELAAAGHEALARETSFEAATAITDASGAFTFLGVTPGQYMLRVQRVPERPLPSPGSSMTTVIQTGTSTISSGGGFTRVPERIPDEPTLWASMPLAVGGSDVSGVVVTLSTGARIRGRVLFDGTGKPPPPDRLETMTLTIESSDGRSSSSLSALQARTGRVDAEGRFNSYQLPPGSYILRSMTPPPDWTFAGAMLDGRDVTVEPLQLADADVTDLVIRFTDRPSELGGTVSTDPNANDAELMVVVFPADPRGWTNYGPTPRRLPASNLDGGGPFTFTGLPDGEYCVAAIRQDATREWRDPAFLKKLAPLATRVKIAEGQKASAALRVVEVR